MDAAEASWQPVKELVENLGKKKIQEMLELARTTEEWEDLGVRDGVHSHRLKTASGLYVVKSTGVLDFPAEVVYAVTQNFPQKQGWDQLFAEGRIVKEFAPYCRVLYERYAAPWPLSHRDFIYGFYKQVEENLIVSVGFSIPVPHCPPLKGLVRGHMEIAGYVFRKLGPNKTHMTYAVHVDPKGSIPSKIINHSQIKQTQNFNRIRTFLHTSL